MSKMNLQKLREICHRQDRYLTMAITLPQNDPANFVKFYKPGIDRKYHTAQVNFMHCMIDGDDYSPLWVNYHTEDPDVLTGNVRQRELFNLGLIIEFNPRLNQILAEHGFHSSFLPKGQNYRPGRDKPFVAQYHIPNGFALQIKHACYTDGRSMRAAVEFQAHLNKTGQIS